MKARFWTILGSLILLVSLGAPVKAASSGTPFCAAQQLCLANGSICTSGYDCCSQKCDCGIADCRCIA